jgi:glycosyltransferase involved in cell wall biosynthesis
LILINDGSDDGSDQIYRKYFEFLGLDKSQYLYIVNKKRFSAMQNYYTASTKFCDKESIVIPLDADDELIGRNTLKLFNWAYQTHKAGVVYSNFYWYIQSMKVMNGFTSIL